MCGLFSACGPVSLPVPPAHLLGLRCLHLGLLHLSDGAHGLAGHGHGRHGCCLLREGCEMSFWSVVSVMWRAAGADRKNPLQGP
jgi:hypothetical protein